MGADAAGGEGALGVRARIRAAWGAPSAPAAGPRRRDVVLVGIVAAAAVVETALRSDLAWPVPTAAVTILFALGLPWRRRHPLPIVVAVALVAAGFALAAAAAGAGQNALASMFVAIVFPYALFRWGSGRARIIGGLVLFAGLTLSTALGGEGIPGAVAGVAFVGGTCLAGALRRERVMARGRERDAIRARERESLARDLHDTVAHHVSAVVVHAQAARALLPADPDRAADSLAEIERGAQAALGDMRSLVRMLRRDAGSRGETSRTVPRTDRAGTSIARDGARASAPPASVDFVRGQELDAAPLAPTPGIDALVALAADGPPAVRVRVDAGAIPDVLAQAAFRIAQEAVTNARRHARGATAIDVAVREESGDVIVEVRDDGSAPFRMTEGYGILGMTERATLLGGSLAAGPEPEGGWRVRGVLPRGGVG
ncbi:sensor histidine kinase [Microbacterium karelineae]|uniref:sensor histidine kinase n=1 Tax=Microbacterium karelineae TaxID=2654283 RepID=UPI0018D4D29C|nr:histidine kinase [Microbacterium karelineae]